MATGLPHVPALGKGPKVGPGRSVGLALPKVPNTLGTAGLFSAPPKAKVAAPLNPYDAFTIADPYKASAIPGLANSSYASDVANDQKLAGMGYLTQAQRDAQAGNQASNATAIGSALAAQIAGIQQATVAQGNASGAALGAQNTATGSSGSGVAGLAGVAAPAGVSAPAVNAILGTQNAATGNLYGGLQSAALASGAQNAKQAYANEAVNVQNDQLNQAKTLASLLAGLASPSTRESTMTAANQTANAANTQSDLAIWTNLQNQELTDKTLNNKAAINRDDLINKTFLAGLSNTEKTNLANAGNTTKVKIANSGNRTKAQIAADNAAARAANTATTQSGANKRAAAANKTRLTAAQIAAKARVAAAGADAKGNKTYRGGVSVPVTTTDPITGLKTTKNQIKPKTFTASQWNAYLKSGPAGKRNLSILGLPNGSRVNPASITGNRS